VEKAPPFVASLKKAKASLEEDQRHVFTFFSGDAFSPSSMSTVLRGEQMLPVLNALSIDAACLGELLLMYAVMSYGPLFLTFSLSRYYYLSINNAFQLHRQP
jgi:hypothetical protein